MTNNEVLPPQLPGLDLAEALARIEIPVEVFKKILLKFAENNRGKAGEMFAVLANGDLQSLSMMAHTLQGGSASMGAIHLQQDCLAVEMAVKEQKKVAEIKALMSDLARSLDIVITSLDSLR